MTQLAAVQGQVQRAGILAGAHVQLYTAIGAPQLAVDTGAASVFAGLREQAQAAI